MANAVDPIAQSGSARPAQPRVAMEPLIDQLCGDLKGTVSRERVARVVADLIRRYGDAPVTAYLPIIVRRTALERLRAECGLSVRGR